MKLRVVAIPLFAAICLASPAITSGEQAQRGRGYRPREGGGGTQTAEKSGGDNNRGGGDRTAATNSRPAERRAETRTADRDNDSQRTASTDNSRAEERRGETRTSDRDDNERYAVPRTYNAVVNSPRNTSRDYRDRDYYINIGSSYRGGHYAPVHYDYWARRYYHWSPIGYAPWSLIYGSIGFSNFGFYGGVGPSPFYYGYNGYGYSYGPGIYSSAYPTYSLSAHRRRRPPEDPAARRAGVRRWLLRGARRRLRRHVPVAEARSGRAQDRSAHARLRGSRSSTCTCSRDARSRSRNSCGRRP